MTDDDNLEDDSNRCGGCSRPLTQGWVLCNRCSEKLSEDLLEIADRHHRLNAAPSPQPGRYDPGRSSTAGSRPPVRLEVTALTDFRSGQSDPVLWRGADGKQHRESERDTPAVLRAVLGWCEAIAAERGFTEEPWLPATPTPIRQPLPRFTMADHDEMTGCVDWIAAQRERLARPTHAVERRRRQWAPTRVADGAVDWLNRQDDWIARWPSAGELTRRARSLRNRLRSACGDPNPRPVGTCFRFVPARDDTQVECGAPIFPPEPEPGRPTPAMYCSSPHRHEYNGLDILRLKVDNDKRDEEAAS